MRAPSDDLDADDAARRELAIKLIERSNSVAVDFAKHVVTLAFSAAGVVLALQDQWIDDGDDTAQTLVGVALGLLLVAGLVSSFAVAGQRIEVSLSDYFDVDRQLSELARRRSRLTSVAVVLVVLGATLTAVTALTA